MEDDDKDAGEDVNVRREDAELEQILREYNNEARQTKNEEVMEKPLDMPFYKGIQLP